MRIALFYSSLDYPEDFSKSKDSARVLVDLIEERYTYSIYVHIPNHIIITNIYI